MNNNIITDDFCPFFINTNLILNNNELNDIDYFFATIARNMGNSYIGYSIIKILYGFYKKVDQIQSIWNYDFSQTAKDTSYINENYTHIIFCFQNQWNADKRFSNLPWKKLIKFIKKIKIPIIPVNLGCNCLIDEYENLHKILNKDLITFFQVLSSKSEFFGVRGEKTLELLSKLGINNVMAVGCPTFYEELNPFKQITKKKITGDIRIILNNPDIIESDNAKNLYILQDEKLIVELLYFKNSKLRQYLNKKEQFLIRSKLFNNNVVFCPYIEQWKQNINRENYDLCLGSRMHGAIMALNSSIPAVVFQNDVRAFEMCDLLKIPFFKLSSLKNKKVDIEKLYEKISYSDFNKNFKKNYDNFKSFLLKSKVPFELSKKADVTRNNLMENFDCKLSEDILDDILNNININLRKNVIGKIMESILFIQNNNKKLSPILQKSKHKIYVS